MYGIEVIKVFGEHSSAITDFIFITKADNFFPNDDFFPNINNLFDNMGDNTNNANVKVNASSSSGLYVILPLLYEIMLRTLISYQSV
jgi:hypothetical protein